MNSCPSCGEDPTAADLETERLYAEEAQLSLDEQLQQRMTFGKYKNHSLEFVLTHNPGYLVWAHENVEFFSLSEQLLADADNRKSIKDAEYRGMREEDFTLTTGMSRDDIFFGDYD